MDAVIARFFGPLRVIVIPILHGLVAKAGWDRGIENAKAHELGLALRALSVPAIAQYLGLYSKQIGFDRS
jgi:hypothetical protein